MEEHADQINVLVCLHNLVAKKRVTSHLVIIVSFCNTPVTLQFLEDSHSL